jgi:hypothetical protein
MTRKSADYSCTLIYKITCKDHTVTDLYVGHTTDFVSFFFSVGVIKDNTEFKKISLDLIKSNTDMQKLLAEVINKIT